MKILKGGFWPPFNCLPVSINIFSAEGADVSGEDDPLKIVSRRRIRHTTRDWIYLSPVITGML